ncbi:MAG: hypothetical protein II692_01070, partial [Paludibacteraceae bacterium]|nr:hypothetical protein [Paludibacteraceae bacterium]
MLPWCGLIADDTIPEKGSWSVTGAIQHESLFPTVDISDERTAPRAKWALIDHLSNTYLDVGVRYQAPEVQGASSTFQGISAAVRGELLEWPMLGYEPDFRGYGISHLHVESDFNWGSVTVGDVYGQ